ncbi:beta-aspartyl-peptidase (threonine type) [Reichenbachiella faecimaris]|uniref:Isoaspartyl peptidase n=1 Tax=Reichenbachiella faecimaris TaxID=692418 RepID=A0A1W2GC92_REIFA|nr:isoaspartyl peptidase/L-asparaginase [Reichenbachiella faecimaris]SMD34221.1 beta-aspartyl-peptidase (threonine type) [Reichenbachiella faecimaris]
MKKCILFFLFLSIFASGHCILKAQNVRTSNMPTLVIHGGAGTILKENMTPEDEQAYHSKLEEALNAGYKILNEGGTSEQAVIAAIIIMEDSPLFNAGKGAVFTNEGHNEMDASIMNGGDGSAGAIAGVKIIKNPILAAQAVKNNSTHVMMSGAGAEQFAEDQNLEVVDPTYFYTEGRKQQLEKLQKAENAKEQGSIEKWKDSKYGTVGAVALDKNGNICAATSTGGMTNKKYGRIGDSPVIGAGTFASEVCGVSATGHGEYFIRNVVAYDIAARMEYKNVSLELAAEEVIMGKLKTIGGDGGVIALDAKGNISMTFNTPGMYRGYIQKEGKPRTFIYKIEH